MKQIDWKKHPLRVYAGVLLLGLAVVYAAWCVLRPVSGELERICQLLRCLSRCLLLACGGVLLLRPRMKAENRFLLLGAALGICYMLMILPHTVPDEASHYQWTLCVAADVFTGSRTVDSSLLSAEGLTNNVNTTETLLAMVRGLGTEKLSGVMESFSPEMESCYSVQYIPQMLGVGLGLLLKLNRWWLYLLGNFTNLLCYLFITWLAVRTIPKGKNALTLIALLPMALQQASSFSPDGYINSMSFLLIALILRAAEGNERLSGKEYAALTVVALLLAPAKGIYTLLLLLLFTVPAQRFGGRAKRLMYIGGAFLASVVLLLIFEGPWANSLEAQGEAVGGYYTLSWCLTHPVQTVRLVFYSILHPDSGVYGSKNLLWWLESGTGIMLNSFTLLMPVSAIYPMLFVILMSAMIVPQCAEHELITPWQRSLGWLTALLVVCAAFGIMMIAWTPMGGSLIEGVQGRYFLPVFPLIFLGFRGKTFTSRRDMSQVWLGCFLMLHYLCFEEIVNTFLAL